jgi:uncharacterized glyoxalase superfamily protein PhnB
MATHDLFAYLCVADAARAIDFYRRAFGATEKFRLVEPGGRIGHAEVDFDGTTLMLSEEFPEFGIRRPDPAYGHSASLHLHVGDADATIGRAVAAGATLERRPTRSTASVPAWSSTRSATAGTSATASRT